MIALVVDDDLGELPQLAAQPAPIEGGRVERCLELFEQERVAEDLGVERGGRPRDGARDRRPGRENRAERHGSRTRKPQAQQLPSGPGSWLHPFSPGDIVAYSFQIADRFKPRIIASASRKGDVPAP